MGNHKYIETPERMWELFNDYRIKIKATPIRVQDFVGKDGDEVYRIKERPLTLEGFENYCANQGVIQDIDAYFRNKGGAYADYSAICSHIRREIKQDQIEGGMAGIYNPSITQRLNGLVDKTQDDSKKDITITVRRGDRDNTKQLASGTIKGISGEE